VQLYSQASQTVLAVSGTAVGTQSPKAVSYWSGTGDPKRSFSKRRLVLFSFDRPPPGQSDSLSGW
jgi:hypothetical protein